MNLFGVLDISGSALTAERERAEIVTSNLANAETTSTPEGGPYKRVQVVFAATHPQAAAAFRMRWPRSADLAGARRAGAAGRCGSDAARCAATIREIRTRTRKATCAYPNVNPSEEMVDLMGAARSYDLNASAIQTTKSMIESVDRHPAIARAKRRKFGSWPVQFKASRRASPTSIRSPRVGAGTGAGESGFLVDASRRRVEQVEPAAIGRAEQGRRPAQRRWRGHSLRDARRGKSERVVRDDGAGAQQNRAGVPDDFADAFLSRIDAGQIPWISRFKQVIAFLEELEHAPARCYSAPRGRAIGLTLWIFVRLFGTPDMQPLYTGLSRLRTRKASRSASRARMCHIRFRATAPRSPFRPTSLTRCASRCRSDGPPQSGRLGFELFDKPNWSGSDFSEKVNYQRALEGELERTIETIDDIQAARVHIVLPHESLFADQDREGKAAVVLKLRGGARIPDTVVAGISRLVSSAVDNLPPENVTVVDADTGAPMQVHGAQSGSSGSSTLETDLAQRLVDTLTPIVGQGGRESQRDRRARSHFGRKHAGSLRSEWLGGADV